MTDIINKSSINMGELSKQNGMTEFENFKMIMEVLEMKARICGKPQRVLLAWKLK